MTTYRPAAVAKMLTVKVDVVYQWIRAKQLTAIDVSERRGGRPRWRISEEALQEFLRSRQTVKPAQPARRRKRATVTQYF